MKEVKRDDLIILYFRQALQAPEFTGRSSCRKKWALATHRSRPWAAPPSSRWGGTGRGGSPSSTCSMTHPQAPFLPGRARFKPRPLLLKTSTGRFFKIFLYPMYLIQHCFNCRPSDSTVSEFN
jgi:hypothetical protein